MARIPFPHILGRTLNGNEKLSERSLRVVTDQDLDVGGMLVAKHHNDYNSLTGKTVGIYDVYKVNAIYEKRKANGDWSAWPKHPFYYELDAAYINRLPETEITSELPSEVNNF